MKSRSRRVCIIGTAFCLGMLICAAGQAEEPGQNAPPLPPGAEALPPELSDLEKMEAPPLPPELQELAGEEAPPELPPELQQLQKELPDMPPEFQQFKQMMEQKSAPPSLPQEEKPQSGAEKPAAEATAKDKLDDTKVKKNEAP